MGRRKQKLIEKKQFIKDDNSSGSDHQSEPQDQQVPNGIQSLSEQQGQEQQEEESSPVEAAIKTMNFRMKRGAKMKDLMKGKVEKDQFWEKHNVYFGGDLKGKDEDQHQSEYQASSSGRDQFDSDFDLTDSYPGKRGRKKGQKVKRKIKREGQSRPRGRPRKIKPQSSGQAKVEEQIQKDSEIKQKKKVVYKQIPIKANDAINQKKKQNRVTKQVQKQEQNSQKPCLKQQED